MAQQTTKYTGVYKNEKGRIFYEIELGVDKVTGKRIRKKSYKNKYGQNFSTAHDAHKERTRVQNEYYKIRNYSNYNLPYDEFMRLYYIPYYKTSVKKETFEVRETSLIDMAEHFTGIPLRSITVQDVEHYRLLLLKNKEDGGFGFSRNYASLIFGMFRKSLDYARRMGYLEENVSKRVPSIPKGSTASNYWTKSDFQAVISTICIDDFYEHLCFVMLWTYFMTGIRVNEGCALYWNDINFNQKKMSIHNMLIIKSKTKWHRQPYTKTNEGNRVIKLDDDTVAVLKEWREHQLSMGLGKDNDFVFSYDSFPMLKSTLSRIIGRYSKLAGVNKIPAKGLRHSHASYLINEFNVTVLILSKRLGHSSPEITLKHYAHMWSGADDVIAQEMSGNIEIKTAESSMVKFNGNQNIKR